MLYIINRRKCIQANESPKMVGLGFRLGVSWCSFFEFFLKTFWSFFAAIATLFLTFLLLLKVFCQCNCYPFQEDVTHFHFISEKRGFHVWASSQIREKDFIKEFPLKWIISGENFSPLIKRLLRVPFTRTDLRTDRKLSKIKKVILFTYLFLIVSKWYN